MGIKNIYWHAFFKVNTKEKVRKLLTKFDDVCEIKATLLVCERYWKDTSVGIHMYVDGEAIFRTSNFLLR